MKSSSIALIGLLTGLLLVGCGSQPLSKAEYRSKFNGYAQEFRQAAVASKQKIDAAQDPAGRAAGLGEFKAEYEKLASQLGGLAPPASAKSAHEAVIGALRKAAQDIGATEQAVRASNAAKSQSSAQTFQADNAKFLTALQDLGSKIRG